MATNYSTQEALNMLVELYQIIIANGGIGETTPGSKWLSGSTIPDNITGVLGDWYLNTDNYDIYNKTGDTVWTLKGNIAGSPGNNGVDGTDGSDGIGSVWLSDSASPNNSLGKITDWYLNTSNYNIYEKTDVSTWTLRGNIKGVDGVNGVGSIWLTSSGAPTDATGKVTDWYLNTTNYDVYEKTGSSTWTLRGNIKGATGSTGTAGTNRSQWLTGTTTPGTGTGVIGDWYLNTTNYDIHQKTGSSTWTLRGNIKGATGTNGTSANFTYSTLESSTGNYWIDGKLIYRKTINIGNLPNNASKKVAHGITGLTYVIGWEGNAYLSSGAYWYPFPYTSPSGSNQFSCYVTPTDVVVQTSSDRSATIAYITLFYTK